MDITIDGFHSWMWKGLSFLLPFLYIGYLMQLYNGYTLYQLIYVHDVGWQVPVLAALFTALGCGNIVTTSMTIPLKLRDSQTGQLKYRFTRLTNISGRTENAGTRTDRPTLSLLRR